MQASENAAENEKGKRDKHASRATTGGVESSGTAAVRELHTDTEHESADDERRAERRHRPAEAGHQRCDWHDDGGANSDEQQGTEQAVGLSVRYEASPRRGEAELGPEKNHAERKAAKQERS